jgi:hypothetical protein
LNMALLPSRALYHFRAIENILALVSPRETR